jgi:hypothetical protein
MAGKANFTPEEWTRVVASPLIASMAITAADPSGLWGLLKEAMAGGWSLLDAKQSATASPLAKAGGGHREIRDQNRRPRAHAGSVQRRSGR